jgi:hypothetical protein
VGATSPLVKVKERAAALGRGDVQSSGSSGAHSAVTRTPSSEALMNAVKVKDRAAVFSGNNKVGTSTSLRPPTKPKSVTNAGIASTVSADLSMSSSRSQDDNEMGLQSTRERAISLRLGEQGHMRRHSIAAGSKSGPLSSDSGDLESGAIAIASLSPATSDIAGKCAAVLNMSKYDFLVLEPEGPLDAVPPEQSPDGTVQFYSYRELVRRNFTKVFMGLIQTELERYITEEEFDKIFGVSKVCFLISTSFSYAIVCNKCLCSVGRLFWFASMETGRAKEESDVVLERPSDYACR